MSEQNNTDIVKNHPGSGYGTPNAEGAIVSTDAGNTPNGTYYTNSDGSYLQPNSDQMAAYAQANWGSTTGNNAVNPSGIGGGILAPEQARRFIDYVWDATILAKDGRKVTMRANSIELEKVNVGERVIRAAKQGDASHINVGATFSKVELTTTKIRLDWEVSTEALEDNIEGGALEDHLVRLMTNAFANDIEDLAINGQGNATSDPFLGIMEGFVTRTTGLYGNTTDAHEAVVSVSNNDWTPEVMQKIILAMPRKYRAVKSNLKFYAGTDAFAGIVKNNGTLADAIASSGMFMGTPPTTVSGTPANRQNYFDGQGQTFGGARTTRVLGIDVQEVPYYPEGFVDLTFPSNRVWGFQRDITVNRQYHPKKDTIEYTVFVRFGLQWEELDAVAYADTDSYDLNS
jgi:hypothetical protein